MIVVTYHEDLKEVQADAALAALLGEDHTCAPFDRLAWWRNLAETCDMLPLIAVARLSIGLMVALVLITVLAVAVAMFFVANWFAQPIRLLGESMREIAKGRFDHRIAEQRKDEFGQLYATFDQMAQALADRQSGAVVGPATPTPLPTRADASTAPAKE